MIPAIPCSFAVLVARRDERDERDERTIAGTDSLYQYLEQAGRVAHPRRVAHPSSDIEREFS